MISVSLDGGTGSDGMVGGAGDDTYVVDTLGDVAFELAGGGYDTIESSITWTLGAEIEKLTLAGTAALNANGNSLSNYLVGNSANNILSSGGGADRMDGGSGDDTYVFDVPGVYVMELANEGTDTVLSSSSLTLNTNVENLTLTGVGAINGVGNSSSNTIIGNGAANSLDGGAGVDNLAGGTGNDTYGVDNLSDVVSEAVSAGSDTVQASVTWAISSNFENLTLTGTAAINGTGNSVDNLMTGNGEANSLMGDGGNDSLDGLAGNDMLNGGTGTDTMRGGMGNDIYILDSNTDAAIENANEGADTVQVAFTWTLGANIESLVLTGTNAVSGTGNVLDNFLVGNSANNSLAGGDGNDNLDGGTGSDALTGGAGNDAYVVDVNSDVVTELANGGSDIVQSSLTWVLGANFENLTLIGKGAIDGTGTSANNLLVGNVAANALSGGGGNDMLDGGLGSDNLTGGGGDDRYIVDVVTDVISEAANGGTDTVQSSVTLTLASNLENLTLSGASTINGTGNIQKNALIGNSASNVLSGAAGDDIYDGGTGNDVFSDSSSTSNETYLWGTGSGLDRLADSGGALDHVDLFEGITKSQLQFARSGDDLELRVGGQADKLTVNNWYASATSQIEEFRLYNGDVVLASEIQTLVSAMSVFSVPDSTDNSGSLRHTHQAHLFSPFGRSAAFSMLP